MVSGDRVGPTHSGSPFPDRDEQRASHEDSQFNSVRSTRVARPNKLVSQQMLDEIGIRHRIAYPLSPKKTVATLHVLAELMSPPDRE